MAISWRAVSAALIIAGAISAAAPCRTAEAQAVATLNIKLVNGRQLLKDAPGAVDAQNLLQRETAYFEEMMTKMGDSLRAMQAKYQADEPTLAPASRTTRQKELQDKLTQYQNRSDSLRGVVERRQQEVLQPVIDLVNRVLMQVREEEGISLVFDLAADGQPIVAYDKNLDITDRVLAKVKAQPKPTLPPTIAKSVAKPPPPAPEPR